MDLFNLTFFDRLNVLVPLCREKFLSVEAQRQGSAFLTLESYKYVVLKSTCASLQGEILISRGTTLRKCVFNA